MMEHVTLTLAVVLLAVFLLVATNPRKPRVGTTGRLLLRVSPPASLVFRLLYLALAAGCLVPVVMAWELLPVAVGLAVDGAEAQSCITDLGIYLGMCLLGAVYLFRVSFGALEVRERGVALRSLLRWRFFPWREIRYCQWAKPPGTFEVQRARGRARQFVRRADVDRVNAALAGRVEVRDADGNVVVEAPEDAAAQQAGTAVTPRRLRFRLSTLLLLAAVVAAWLAWGAIYLRRAAARRAAIADLEHAAASVRYDDADVVGLVLDAAACDDDLAAVGRLEELRGLTLRSPEITDAGMAHIEGLVRLKYLDLGKTSVTDAGLVHLRGLTDLGYLRLPSATTDAGLDCLGAMSQLADLDLRQTRATGAGLDRLPAIDRLQRLTLGPQTTDAGLTPLAGAADLESLDLHGSQVAGPGLAHLANLGKLRTLNLEGTLLADAGLAGLPALGNLDDLHLARTATTDAGLAHVGKLAKLRSLDLSGTQVTDAGLVHLEALAELETLDLTGTPVTQAGITRLLKALPQLFLWPRPAANPRPP